MRGVFALILGASAAVAVGISLWGPEIRGTAASQDDTVAPDRVVTNPGATSPAAGPLPPPTPPIGPGLRSTLERVDALLAEGSVEAAAGSLLKVEAAALDAPAVRSRVLRTAAELVASADAAHGAAGTDLRLRARRLYAAIYDNDAASADEHERALRGCETLHRALLFGSGAPDEVVLRHRLKSGDRVWNLAKGPWKQAGVTVAPGFVLHVNGISDARRVPAHGTLRVPLERLSLLVRKSRFELTVLLGGAPVQRFQVGIGANESTPVGRFRIKSRIKNPDWYYDGRRIPFGDEDNLIGTRWLGFEGDATASGIGIHGTNDESSIGKAMSLGCIRMKRADVERVFEWIAAGTEVDVRD